MVDVPAAFGASLAVGGSDDAVRGRHGRVAEKKENSILMLQFEEKKEKCSVRN